MFCYYLISLRSKRFHAAGKQRKTEEEQDVEYFTRVKIPFLGLSLLLNPMETLAMQTVI